MLFTQSILLASACLASAAYWKNHGNHHRRDAASVSASSLSTASPPQISNGAPTIPSNLAASGQNDEQDDCDADIGSEDSGEKSSEGTVVGNPGINVGSGGVPVSSSSSSASAPESQSSTPALNAGVATNEKAVLGGGQGQDQNQDQNQNQGQAGSLSTSASVSTAQSSSSTAPAPSATTSTPSTPPSSNGGVSPGQKDALHVAAANDNSNVVVQAPVPLSSSSSIAPAVAASPSTAASSSPSTSPAGSGGSMGGSFTASFTEYGSNDKDGSGNCNTASAACGFFNNPGYNAAISQAVFGAGPGGGAGPACGHCYKLMPDHPKARSIVVKVNNLCPDDGNPMCSYPEGVDVNFDLCKDDLAASGLFGDSGTQQVNGTAVLVDCGQWSGSADKTG